MKVIALFRIKTWRGFEKEKRQLKRRGVTGALEVA